MILKAKLYNNVYEFKDVKDVLAKASAFKHGDHMLGIAATSELERTAAKEVLANLTIGDLRNNPCVPYEEDEVTRVNQDDVNERIYEKFKNMTIGDLREYILKRSTTQAEIEILRRGITAEVAAGVAKLMTNLELMYAARKIRVESHCNTTLGKAGIMGTRVQPNHPADDTEGIKAIVLEGLSYGCGDVCLGINPAADTIESTARNLAMLNEVKEKLQIPTQTVMLSHITNQMECLKRGIPMDLIFESIGGTQKCNDTFGVSKKILDEAVEMLRVHGTGAGPNVLYFESGQGPETANGTHCNIDQATLEARTLAFGAHFKPYCMNTIMAFIGPEVEYGPREVTRAGLENHFAGKLQGVPCGCDCAYVTHNEGDFNETDIMNTMGTLAGANYWVAVPGASECMVAAIELSYHDVNTYREILGVRPIKEFEDWCKKWGIFDDNGFLTDAAGDASIFL